MLFFVLHIESNSEGTAPHCTAIIAMFRYETFQYIVDLVVFNIDRNYPVDVLVSKTFKDAVLKLALVLIRSAD